MIPDDLVQIQTNDFNNSLIFLFRVSFEWLHNKSDNLSDMIPLSDAMYMTSVLFYVSFYIIIL